MNWSTNDNLFISELNQGYNWQSLPALYFKLHGLEVQMPDLTIRDSINDADKWVNSVDLLVKSENSDWFPIEVKSRNYWFIWDDSEQDVNIAFPDVFVDTVAGWDKKDPKPLAYVMVSRKTGSMFCIKSTSNKNWTKRKKWDNVRKIEEEFYVCPKTKFRTLDRLVSFIRSNSDERT